MREPILEAESTDDIAKKYVFFINKQKTRADGNF